MNNDSIINFKVSTVTDNTKKLQETIRKLATRQVMVGYPQETAKPREKGDPISNAELAYIHDHGSPANNIPPRPFLEPGIQSVKLKLQKRLAQGARAALDGDEEAVDKSLNSVGLDAVSGVRAFIVAGNFSPLKAGTLRARRKKGFTGTKILQESGQMRNAVNYAIRTRKGGL